DVVLEIGDLALGLDLDVPREIALRHGRRDLRDRADLSREVRGEQVYVRRQVLPRAGRSRPVRLAAELALGADLARDARDLGGEAVQLIDHRVDRVLELEQLALDIDGDLAREVAARDRGCDLGDAAYLVGEVRGHHVHVVREVLPRARDAGDLSLAAELALGADLARDARDLGGEAVQLVDHRVDRVLELEDLALDVDRDLAG